MGFGISRIATRHLAAAVLVSGSALFSPAALATGTTATSSGSAQATVVAPIAAREIADLDFGAVASDAARGGTVTVAAGSDGAAYAGGARSGCNGANCRTAHAARFAVSGEANRSYVVWTPGSISVAGIPLGGSNAPALTVNGISVHTDSRPNAGPHGQLGPDGTDTFGVGGVLQVPAGLGSAHYRVSVTVVLNYS